MSKTARTLVWYVVLPLVLVGIGFFIGHAYDSAANQEDIVQSKDSREIHSGGKLTSPLLSCELSPQLGNKEFDTFENDIRSFVERKKFLGNVTDASVYFRELNNGAWFGINEKENFTPASLLKVPSMIAILKASESDPTVLSKKLSYDHVFDTGIPYYKPSKKLEIGKEYAVDDLLERMIAQSDNESMMLLANQFEDFLFQQTYKDLGMQIPKMDEEDFMSVKNYSAFFRILYNASYLTPSDSEKALEILSRTVFKDGIVAGVPTNVTVAHKFGERYYNSSSVKQLHDCGIVYQPKTPYLLCIMTRGSDYDVLAQTIADISKQVWDEMGKRYLVK
jgi:beta-lactamase class A